MIEVLKQALEALEDVGVLTDREWQAVHKNKANELRQAIVDLESQEPVAWIEGYPKAHYAEEWFIAKLNDGDRVVLQALPEEFKHDFTTRDGTYFLKESIKSWMQFPDTEFLPPPQRTWQGLTDDEHCDIWYKESLDWMEYGKAIEAKLKEKNT